MKPNEEEVRGKIDQATGAIKEKLGRATGNPNLEAEGADQRVAGDLEHGVGKARRKVGEFVKNVGDKLGK